MSRAVNVIETPGEREKSKVLITIEERKICLIVEGMRVNIVRFADDVDLITTDEDSMSNV